MLGLNLDLSLTQSFGSRVSAIKRYFTKFNASLNQYIDLSSAIVLDGDFKIDVTCVMESSGTTTLMGLSDSGFSRLQRVATASTSTIRFRMSGYNVDLADDIVTTDGKLRKHTFTRVGDTFSYYEDDVLVDSTTDVGADGRSLGINCLGQSNNFNYIDSYYANFVVENNGVEVLNMLVDEDGTDNTVINTADPANNGTRINMTSANADRYSLNEELNLWVNTVELWDRGDYTYTGNEGEYALLVGAYTNGDKIFAGETYLWSYSTNLVKASISSQVRFRLGSQSVSNLTGDQAVNATAQGITTIAADDTRTDMLVQTGADPQFVSGTVTDVSVRKALEIAS